MPIEAGGGGFSLGLDLEWRNRDMTLSEITDAKKRSGYLHVSLCVTLTANNQEQYGKIKTQVPTQYYEIN